MHALSLSRTVSVNRALLYPDYVCRITYTQCTLLMLVEIDPRVICYLFIVSIIRLVGVSRGLLRIRVYSHQEKAKAKVKMYLLPLNLNTINFPETIRYLIPKYPPYSVPYVLMYAQRSFLIATSISLLGSHGVNIP